MKYIDYTSCALSATRSKIAYVSYSELKTMWANNSGDETDLVYQVFKDVKDEPKYYNSDWSYVNAYSMIQSRTLHIVFRGTEGVDDVKIDLMVPMVPLLPGNKSVYVHDGFLKQFRSIHGFLLDTIFDALKKGLIDSVHFTGHSLGGALATLAAGYFSPVIREYGCRIKCHTFGCPRLGNSGFVEWFKGLVDESYRVLNFKDPVPLIPVNCFYRHINGGIELDDKGGVTILDNDAPFCMRLLYLPFDIYYRHPIANHACDLYINRLLELAS
jgi:predicted lipase